eukprot:CAMPEP_0117486996 /NCGR_PEP_ID=MMETSP0784-20121206/15768_1 /TAXON_ID=39447 /ORGANISM="" /LENGTH=144 /DNA_ID=CAMNT_0005281631 /DNA_START=201 /DNA_END=632 /DNA_ORIENTATION=-
MAAPLLTLLVGLLWLLALRLLAEVGSVALEVPLLVRLRVDLHDGVLQQRLRSHQLVARRVVNHVQDPHLPRAILRTPGVVPAVEPQGTVLHVAAAAAHRPHTFCAELCHGWRAAHLELPLLLVNVAPAAGLTVLVARIAGDTHG